MKRDLGIAIHNIRRTLNLSDHKKTFEFTTYGGGIVIFDWDGAAKDGKGEIVLFESELAHTFVVSHIQAHVARLYAMKKRGIPVKKLIWIVYPSCRRLLSRMVLAWLELFWDKKVPFVEMEYRDGNGEILN